MDYQNLTGLEFAALRHLLGLTFEDLSRLLDVGEKTLRKWESGAAPIPEGVGIELQSLKLMHDLRVREYEDYARNEVEVLIDRNRSEYADNEMPRNWYVAALARVAGGDGGVEASWT